MLNKNLFFILFNLCVKKLEGARKQNIGNAHGYHLSYGKLPHEFQQYLFKGHNFSAQTEYSIVEM